MSLGYFLGFMWGVYNGQLGWLVGLPVVGYLLCRYTLRWQHKTSLRIALSALFAYVLFSSYQLISGFSIVKMMEIGYPREQSVGMPMMFGLASNLPVLVFALISIFVSVTWLRSVLIFLSLAFPIIIIHLGAIEETLANEVQPPSQRTEKNGPSVDALAPLLWKKVKPWLLYVDRATDYGCYMATTDLDKGLVRLQYYPKDDVFMMFAMGFDWQQPEAGKTYTVTYRFGPGSTRIVEAEAVQMGDQILLMFWFDAASFEYMQYADELKVLYKTKEQENLPPSHPEALVNQVVAIPIANNREAIAALDECIDYAEANKSELSKKKVGLFGLPVPED